MSEEQKEVTLKTQEAATDEAAQARGSGRAAAYLALLLALIALAGAGSAGYFQFRAMQADTARAGVLDDLRARLDGVAQRLGQQASGRSGIEDRISELSSRQRQLDESLDNLYRRQKHENIDWAVAEIEHLMVIAQHSVALQKDTDTALAALNAADDRIRDLGDPGLLPVRRQLAADINALNSVADVDISGLSLYLADLAERVESLPLQERAVSLQDEQGGARAAATQDDSGPAWKRLLSGVWQEVKSLVVITRSDKSGQALLMPEEKYFLYQNLRLQLESARASVFRRDTANFHASLELIIDWLQEYFDTDSSAVNNVVQSLGEMGRLDLSPDLPDISSSLESLRAWIKERARSDGDGAAPAS